MLKNHIEFDIEFKKNDYKGLFIAFEGVDASGKSTQVDLLKKYLESKGKKVSVKHPFEGELGEFIRRILSGEKKLPPVSLQYLISANRHIQEKEIKEELEKGSIVIIDRYIWSAVVYGMFDKGNENFEKTSEWLLVEQSILSMYHQFLMPDKTIYLKISPVTAVDRLNMMDKKKEIYEESSKIKKICEIYDWVIDRYPDEFAVIDGEMSVDEISSVVNKNVEVLLDYKR